MGNHVGPVVLLLFSLFFFFSSNQCFFCCFGCFSLLWLGTTWTVPGLAIWIVQIAQGVESRSTFQVTFQGQSNNRAKVKKAWCQGLPGLPFTDFSACPTLLALLLDAFDPRLVFGLCFFRCLRSRRGCSLCIDLRGHRFGRHRCLRQNAGDAGDAMGCRSENSMSPTKQNAKQTTTNCWVDWGLNRRRQVWRIFCKSSASHLMVSNRTMALLTYVFLDLVSCFTPLPPNRSITLNMSKPTSLTGHV